MQTQREMERDVLLCFVDMPLVDALKLLRISSHTMMRLRKQYGLKKWPFEQLKKNSYTMSWEDVHGLRNTQLRRDDLDEDTHASLLAADKRGWLMRRLYAPLQAQDELPHDFFDTSGEEAAAMVAVADEYAPEPSRPEPAPCQPSQPSQDWQALQDTEPESDVVVLDYGLEQDVSPFDEDEWGLLGFDDV
jgi:hypothetical protein